MSDDKPLEDRPCGRREGRLFSGSAVGDTADEIELAALDKARAFFGPDVRLEVVRNYAIVTNWTLTTGKYAAVVNVREVPADG